MLYSGRKSAAHGVRAAPPNLPRANQLPSERSASGCSGNGTGKAGNALLRLLLQPRREYTAHLPRDERGATRHDRARSWGWLGGPSWTPFRAELRTFSEALSVSAPPLSSQVQSTHPSSKVRESVRFVPSKQVTQHGDEGEGG